VFTRRGARQLPDMTWLNRAMLLSSSGSPVDVFAVTEAALSGSTDGETPATSIAVHSTPPAQIRADQRLRKSFR
jgi:hypothetical protein